MKSIKNFVAIFSLLFFAQTIFAGEAKWVSKCLDIEGDYLIKNVTVEDDLWNITYWAYEDSNCRNLYLEVKFLYSVKIQNEMWDGRTLMMSYRPYTNEVAEAFNMATFCGKSNWKRGRVIEVTGLKCEEYQAPSEGEMVYSLIKFEGPRNNILWMGNKSKGNDGTSTERRHRDLDPNELIKLLYR